MSHTSEIPLQEEPAKAELFDLIYDSLRELAASFLRRERVGHTLQPTALVNEAALRCLNGDLLDGLPNRRVLFSILAKAMRRILVDHARRRNAVRRGGSRTALPLDEMLDGLEARNRLGLLELDEALEDLGRRSARQADVVSLRYFGGFEMQEIADQLGLSLSAIEKDWRLARAWLRDRLGGTPS